MDITRIKKHVGLLDNTGARCIVVFREIPEETGMCLIVETDRLPDMVHDNLIEFVNSAEARKTHDFADILNRRTLSDGTNALQALHFRNMLRKVPVDSVTLIPFPGNKLPLKLLNAQLAGPESIAQYLKEEDEIKEKEKPSLNNTNELKGKHLLVQADLLESEANAKREEAYALFPNLKGIKKVGRPKLSDKERAIRQIEKKEKRRIRLKKKAAALKEEKAEYSLEQKVAEKIARDINVGIIQ